MVSSSNEKKCNRCEIMLPLTKFSKDKNKSDGYRTICRSCSSLSKKTKHHGIPKDHKCCGKCGIAKVVTEFGYKTKNKDGLKSYCNSCEISYTETCKLRSTKKCTECHETKNIALFHKNSTKYDGYSSECKKCNIERSDAHRQKQIELVETSDRPLVLTCLKCKILHPISHFCRIRGRTHGVDKVCKTCFKSTSRGIGGVCSTRVRTALRNTNALKSAKTVVLIGCSWAELKQHLENQFSGEMCWENHGSYWHIDHKQPCAGFDLTIESEQKKCFHYSNLQPLEKSENFRKHDMPYDEWLLKRDSYLE